MRPIVTDLHRPATSTRGSDCTNAIWSLALERVVQDRGVLLPSMLGAERLRRLRAEVGGWPLRPAQERVGVVRQFAETGTLAVEQWSPALRETATWLTQCTQGSGWTPNEARIMAHSGIGAGISPHRAHRRYV